ncbi:MAG TPA: HWE histidine kinase domain-containing protein [Caulobacteraceae bacterium]
MTRGAAFNEFLRRRIAERAPLWQQVGWGLFWALVAIVARLVLSRVTTGTQPFVMFYPAVLAASVFGGLRGGLACLAVIAAGAAFWYAPLAGPVSVGNLRRWAPALIFLLSTGLTVWLAVFLRRALVDLTESREQERLMIGELQHRVRNTLAIVQTLADQTLRSTPTPADFRREFSNRLVALAQAHELVSEAAWTTVSLRELARRTLAPFVDEQTERVTVQGDDLLLPPDSVVSLTLCLYELATNATKYGSLSRDGGRVEIAWTVEPDRNGGRVSFSWAERDGPPVAPPVRRGFGSRLLRQGLNGRLRPRIDISFAPEGVRWTAEFDVGLAQPAG